MYLFLLLCIHLSCPFEEEGQGVFENFKCLLPELHHPNHRVAHLHDHDDGDGDNGDNDDDDDNDNDDDNDGNDGDDGDDGDDDNDDDDSDDLVSHLDILLCLLHRLPAVEGCAERHLAAELHHLPPDAVFIINVNLINKYSVQIQICTNTITMYRTAFAPKLPVNSGEKYTKVA